MIIAIIIPNIAGKFSRVQIFTKLLESRSEFFTDIRVSMPENHPTHQQALHVKYRFVGVYPSFDFRVNCSALEKRENLHCTKISRKLMSAKAKVACLPVHIIIMISA